MTISNRPTKDEYFLSMAKLAGSRSSCLSRKVGCILVDKNNVVLATGYNGPPSGFTHCAETGCLRSKAQSGDDLANCMAIHAERNALMFCSDIFKIERAYTTVSPCLGCLVMLMNTSCKHLIFEKIYDKKILEIWESAGRTWTCTGTDVSVPVQLEEASRIPESCWSLHYRS